MPNFSGELTEREAALATLGVDTAAESIAAAEESQRFDDPSIYEPPPGVSFAEYRQTERWSTPGGVPTATDIEVAGVSVHVLEPQLREARGTYVHLHGGGWSLGFNDGFDEEQQRLAEETGLRVWSVDYRLAPEHPYPAGLEDVLAVLREVPAGIRVVGGESAGAHLTALALLALRDAGERGADGAVLNYGAFDLAGTPSSGGRLEQPSALFLPGVGREQRRDPRYSPLSADLAGLPPARFVVGTRDYLLDDTLMMEARWRQVAATELDIAAGAAHGFTGSSITVAKLANAAERRFLAAIADGAAAG
ncbi:alpha/beta fold hydrolase [Pseudonocardiaceae bacterium YIM PH 21723]|nr:alpha/beta fold hydrolase [Pseudonocardiaceae bacterium YIM PH 21723]